MRGWALALALAAGCLAACAQRSREPMAYPPVLGRTPTLVFDSPAVLRARAERPVARGWQATWYYDRQDLGPVAVRAYESGVLREQMVRTYDAQRISSGRVRADFNRTSRQYEYSRQAR